MDELKNKVEDDVFTADSVAHGSSSVGAAMNRVKSCLNYSLKQKYGIENDDVSETILRVHGLSKKNLEFINNFESLVESKAEVHSDESEEANIDQNANKSDVSVSGILVENSAPIAKLLGYRYLYRKMVEMYGKQRAKFLCGEMYDYSLALADSTNVLKPYSYYSNTPIYIKTNEKESFITLKDLFDKYSNFSHYDAENNMEVIYTEDLKRNVLFHKTFMCNSKGHIQTYDEDSQFKGEKLVSEKISIKVWDDKNGFVDVTRIIRHKPDVDMVLYQTEDGDFSFVTEDHPVILEDMTEKTARDLVIGDKIKKAELPIVSAEKETVDVPEKLAYFLGFMLGDDSFKGVEQDQDYIDSPTGCIKFLKGNSIISIFQKDIEESRILKIAKELFPESNFWSFSSNSDRVKSFSNWTLSSICSYYFGYNISENSFAKHLPNNIMSWKKESILALAAGLVDAGGTVFKQDGRCLIRVMSTAVVQELYDALIYCGVRAQKYISGSSRDDMTFGISFNPNETIYKWCEKLWSLDKEKCLSPNIKNDKIVRSNKISKIFKISRDKTTSPKPNSFLFDELEYVYDITTSTGHFVSGNMVQHNCFSVNMSRLVLEGRPFGKLHSLPPHRVSSYIACLNETVHQLSNHTAGALAIATLFLDCARVMLFEEHKTLFVLKHSRKYRKYIKNCLQNFVHSMNHLSRNSTESPFTNVSIFDKPKLRDLLNEDNFGWYFDLDKKPWDAAGKNWTEYCVSVVSEMQDIFMDIMDAGDVARNGLPITFPVTTLNISINDNREIIDPEFVKKICKHDIFRYNIFVSQGNKIASCCRLINDEDLFEQGGHVNSLGGGGSVSLGSHRVCTINLYRIFLETNSWDEYKTKLLERLNSCADILQAHKELIKDLTARGLQPFIENGYLDLNRMFSTVGIAGFYEADKHLKEKYGFHDYLKDILETIENFNHETTVSGRGLILNTEEIPAESMMTRLAKVDNLLFGVPEKIYSNQFVPLFEEGHNVFERLDIDGRYGKLLSGGGIVHASLGERTTPEQSEKLIIHAAKAGCNHFALNPCYSICENDHATFGKVETCPICGKPIKDYLTRTIGYFSRVSNWNNNKRENDFEKRDWSVSEALKD